MTLNRADKQAFLISLDDELLKCGVTLSEWCVFLIRDADIAFVAGAYVASIVTAACAIETYLRAEAGGSKQRFVHLIEGSGLDESLKLALHTLRRYRNNWVHVEDAVNDDELLLRPEAVEAELEDQASAAMRTLRRVMYSNQLV